ncbi:hypothetical protein D3C77_640060 [compost metagenome]
MTYINECANHDTGLILLFAMSVMRKPNGIELMIHTKNKSTVVWAPSSMGPIILLIYSRFIVFPSTNKNRMIAKQSGS